MKRIQTILLFAGIMLAGCHKNDHEFDASGSFEADEVIVSSELAGMIKTLTIEEGNTIPKGKVVGTIDATNLNLQKEQVQASVEALEQKTADVNPQIKLLQEQLEVQKATLANLQHEKQRTENLVKADAATSKQLDDINYQIEVLKRQMAVNQQQIKVQKSTVGTQNRSVLSEKKPLEKRISQFEDQLQKANVTNPIDGTVLSKYAEAGEIAVPGKPLYKIADMRTLTLRAYISGNQLSQVKLNQPVKVFVDNGPDAYKEYPGTITWISDKSEFTPKTIQTKDERANLVYAMKVRVKNDGYLKIGMYGDVTLNKQ